MESTSRDGRLQLRDAKGCHCPDSVGSLEDTVAAREAGVFFSGYSSSADRCATGQPLARALHALGPFAESWERSGTALDRAAQRSVLFSLHQ
ncbi:unnamed protein product [Heligmosomoides polygyrus]|uniref:Uncharacterized protein n=1 Tax=Heligmosomoides polygyrus TaxID=6339 RepID=A0A183FT90_HELPZ|nr:unnamed protein product [Heligmosomoides polygyrus]